LLKTVLRPRTLAYTMLWGSVGIAMLLSLGGRTRLDISAQQLRNPVYVQLSDGNVRNSYTVKLRNMQTRPREMEINLAGLTGAAMWRESETRGQAARSLRVNVPPDALAKIPVFVVAPGNGAESEKFAFTVRSTDGEGETDSAEAIFERPAE
jgi:polyferredoxin